MMTNMTSASSTGGYNQFAAQAMKARALATQSNGDLSSVNPKLLASSRAAAQDFEAFFITHSFADMMEDIQPDPVFGGGEGESVFRSFLLDEYGKMVAKTQGIGVADTIQRELLHLQEQPKK
ncbi:MAG: rod-binding protein [Dongiaceae bacterium]